MKCHGYARRIQDYLDGCLPEQEYREVGFHLELCEECAAEMQQMIRVRSELRRLPAMAPPEDLETRLRVMASKERTRRIARASVSALLKHWQANVRLWMNNLMRPLAIPTVGGLTSAVVLFSMLVRVPAFTRAAENSIDVPTPFYTAAAVKSSMAPFGLIREDLFVDVTIDGNGRMVDYTIPQGQPIVSNPALLRDIETHLLFTEFTPAMTFGQPTYGGRVRVYIGRSSIDVKG
jgi:hypothetical protein